MVVEIFEDKEKVKIYANDNNVTLYVDDLALLLEDDFAKQLKVHNYKYNKFPMRPLNWKAPIDYVNAFLSNGEIF